MKKILSIILTVAILATMLTCLSGLNVFAITSGTTGECTWTLDNNGVLTISGKGKMGNYSYSYIYSSERYVTDAPWGANITKVVINNGITSIGNYAFAYCFGLTSIEIPESVTSIGSYAFYACDGLEIVTIPDSVTSINEYAFDCTGWYYNQPDGLVYVGKVAYKYKGICPSTVIIKDGTTEIADYAFCDCTGLTSVVIPDSVTSIGNYAFYGCYELTNVTIPEGVTSIGKDAFSGTAWYNNQSDGLVYVGKVAYKYYGTCPSTVIIKDGTTEIADYAFCDCTGLTSIVIPDSVTSIGDYAFHYCYELTNVKIGNSVTSIGDYAFEYCNGLTSVVIPDSVTSIGDYAFSYSGLTSITIGNGVKSIGDYAFICCGLTSVTIPDSVTSIGDYAFNYCTGLTSVTIGKNVTSIGDSAFEDCTGLTSITIPDSVTSIGKYAFCGCIGLESLTIGKSVTSIGEAAFNGCEGLTSITIPDSVISIGDWAFDGTDWYNNQPEGIVCAGKVVYKYKGTCPSTVTIPYGVTSIGDGAFYKCSELTSIIIPDSVTFIGAAFGYTGLTRVTIPDSVTSIGNGAFLYCESLESVTIPDSVTSIGEGAFTGCEGLISITIPDSVTSIGYGAFYYCTGIESIIVDSNNEKYEGKNNCLIDKETNTLLFGCKNSIIPDDGSVTSIGTIAFDGCYGLKSIVIPDSVTSIGSAFEYCIGLESITIGKNVTSISNYAFLECNCLSIKCYPDSYAMFYAIDNSIPYFFLGDITEVFVKQLPIKTIYPIGGTLQTEGLVIALDFADGAYAEITSGFEIGDYDFSTAGEKTISVSYMDYETSFTVTVDPNMIEYPESKHNYDNNCDESWTVYKKGAVAVSATFSSDTYTESGWDYIYIYDRNDDLVYLYSGDELAGMTVTVSGDTMRIRLKSDAINNYFGFAVTDISYKTAESTQGDISGDGFVDENDVDKLIDILLTSDAEYNEAFDIVNDGVIDVRDVVALKYMLETAEN